MDSSAFDCATIVASVVSPATDAVFSDYSRLVAAIIVANFGDYSRRVAIGLKAAHPVITLLVRER